ncbi:MAG: FkbM family methyltransferase [Steroidobacter sp.]
MGSHYPAYVRRFGLGTGSSLYARTKFKRGPLEITVPGVRHPLHLRAGTSDRNALNEIFVKGWYDHPYPGTPRFIIDAGANVGFASVRFAHMYPEATIVAIEPDAENFALTRRNVAAYRQIDPLRAGVWPRSARLTIENPQDKPWAFRVREARDGEPAFAAISLQDVMARHAVQTIDILKIDVEGAERELLADEHCDEWLARTNMIFIELHDRFLPGCTDALEGALQRHSFVRQSVGQNLLLIRQPLLKANPLPHPGSGRNLSSARPAAEA